ncbi:MAG: molybdopterin-binding protein [Pseudomonas caspiana]
MTDVQLLDKTELWVRGVTVRDADLPSLARAMALALSLPADKIFVTDVGAEHVCFDVLLPSLKLEDFTGKQAQILELFRCIPGITVAADAAIHSEGILGLIGAPSDQVSTILSEAARMETAVKNYSAKRVAVVSTGAELADGRVHDTNYEAVAEILGAAGYEVKHAGTVSDDLQAIAGRVSRIAGEGFGLIITTGGVGAEAKDKTIEALTLLDPGIATAPLAHFQVGHGRHVKNAIRIGIAQVSYSRVVALPGPTHEVRLALPILRDGLNIGLDHTEVNNAELVERIAVALRAVLPQSADRHGSTHAILHSIETGRAGA